MPDEVRPEREFVKLRLWREQGATRLYIRTNGWEPLLLALGASEEEQCGTSRLSVFKGEGGDVAVSLLMKHTLSDETRNMLNRCTGAAAQDVPDMGTLTLSMNYVDKPILYDSHVLNAGVLRLHGLEEGLTFRVKDAVSDTVAKAYVAAVLKFFSEVHASVLRRYDFRGVVRVGIDTAALAGAPETTQDATEGGA